MINIKNIATVLVAISLSILFKNYSIFIIAINGNDFHFFKLFPFDKKVDKKSKLFWAIFKIVPWPSQQAHISVPKHMNSPSLIHWTSSGPCLDYQNLYLLYCTYQQLHYRSQYKNPNNQRGILFLNPISISSATT